MSFAVNASPVVQLCPHGVKSFARDAIGAAVVRRDQAAFTQMAERRKRAVRQQPAFARPACGGVDFSLVVLFDANEAAARERMKRPLLELRDIHG